VRVDAHCHAAQEGWFGLPWWQALAERGQDVTGAPAQVLRETLIPALFDQDGSGQLGAMEAAGVDVAIMYPHDWSLEKHLGRPPVGWKEQNDWYARLADAHADRIKWGFGVDPRHEIAVEAFSEAVRDRGAVCLKLHPSGGWPLDDPVARPLLERAGELAVPVVIHIGPTPEPLNSDLGSPARLDRVAADFPDLAIQAAHVGNEDWLEVLDVMDRRPNVACDLSGWQLSFREDPDDFYRRVRQVLDRVGADRVMWGTDAPYYRPLVSDDDWMTAFAGAPEGFWSAEEAEAVMAGTATRFYSLS
jgi:predicted TIM-barrel fold metal-dependent hydrolase